jgi:predicted amidohydrolase
MADGPMLRVCMAQLRSLPADPAANLSALEACLHRHVGLADLVVFPECFVHGYGPDASAACAENARGSSFVRVSEVAKSTGLTVVYGFSELGDDGLRYIALNWVTAAGELLFTYRKSHLWTPSDFESRNFVPGRELPPIVDLCGVRVATLICFDVEVVEPSRVLALQGAQLLIAIGLPLPSLCTLARRQPHTCALSRTDNIQHVHLMVGLCRGEQRRAHARRHGSHAGV